MAETAPIRIPLYEPAFRQLVAGEVVRTAGTPTVEITLADIGFNRMISAIRDRTTPTSLAYTCPGCGSRIPVLMGEMGG